jgi:ParB family chromosome partitioning protein
MPTHPVATTLVPTSQIHPNPDQPRKIFDPEAQEEMKKSLMERGLISPICVVQRGEGDYIIVAGERRFRAACELGWQEIDARIWPSGTPPMEMDLLTLVENIQRKDLSPIEVANAYAALTKAPHNMTQEQVAQQVGKTQQAVQQYLSIAALDKQVLGNTNRFVNLGLAHLIQICRLKDAKDQIKLAKKASDGGWTVKKLTAEVDKRVKGEGGREKGEKSLSPVTPHPSPYSFTLSGREIIVTARIPLDNNIDPELAKLKTALLQWLQAGPTRPHQVPAGSPAKLKETQV